MNRLYVKNETKFKFCYKFLFWKIINFACKEEKIKGRSEVNLIIVSNHEIKKIARQYQYNLKTINDILIFPADYKKLFNIIGYNMLGDIYMSYQKINSQAKLNKHSLKREWSYIFSHGVYHLLGYDHINKYQEIKMNKKIIKIMKKIKVGKNE